MKCRKFYFQSSDGLESYNALLMLITQLATYSKICLLVCLNIANTLIYVTNTLAENS